MGERPDMSARLDSDTFRNYYYLKEELVAFCRAHGLPVSGGKLEITERIARYLDTGAVLPAKTAARAKVGNAPISEDALIEKDFVCSERHRAFFKEKLGKGFSFNVAFQKWLKANSGKTYADAVLAYDEMLREKKTGEKTIEKQFEYNTYIHDFFADNQGLTLADAIACWKRKKGTRGHNRYERTDLEALR